MANCTDCEKFTFCPLVENRDVDIYAEEKKFVINGTGIRPKMLVKD